jgi:hypothetical protein
MTRSVIILLSCFVCETIETFLPLLFLLWLCVSVKSDEQSTTQNSGRAVKDYHANATCNLVGPSASHQSHSICVVAGCILGILIRFQPHSGQDNYHGSKTAYGGDFEAQRHLMELMVHFPIGDWYDLDYWGLIIHP